MEYKYNVGEIKRFIAESSTKNEFKPVIGDGVESKDKSENEKAYKDSKKRGKDYDGGLDETKPAEPKVEKADGNRTTLSYNPENNSPENKERIKLQAQGYTSKLEKENGIEKDPSLEYNTREFDAFKKEDDEINKNIVNDKAAGLKSHNLPKSTFEKETLHENTKFVKFKKPFLNEEHMISRIPDEMKNEGQVFHMMDSADNDYTVRWSLNEAEVLNFNNKRIFNEKVEKMKHLFGYNPNDYSKYKGL